VPARSISQAVRVEADGLIILPCPGGGRIISRPVQFDHVNSNTTGLVKNERRSMEKSAPIPGAHMEGILNVVLQWRRVSAVYD
jgi:hypothetical protein